MLHPSHNLGLAEEYFETLSEESLSVQFNLGLKYEDTLVNKFLMLFNIKKHYKELGNFYPYTSPITTAAKAYGSEMEEATRKGLIISAVSMYKHLAHSVSPSTNWRAGEWSCPSSSSTASFSRPTASSGTTSGRQCFPSTSSGLW